MRCWIPFLVGLVFVFAKTEVDAYKIVCYFQSWSVYRPSKGLFSISDIDPNLCTHILYAFAGIDSSGDVKVGDSYSDIDEGGYKKINALKDQNSNLKTLISIGGGDAGSQTFSKIMSNSGTRSTFENNIVSFVKKYGFDGADIDWEFPESSSDKSNFVTFLKELRSKFDDNGFLMTAAVSADTGTIDDGYNVPALSQYLDFINVMTYDMHGYWESKTGENSPMYEGPSDTSDYEKTQNVDYMMKYWIQKGASKSKLILGVGSYGNTFTLKSSSNNAVGAPSTGAGKAGPYTEEDGELAYFEICEEHNAGEWTQHWNTEQKSMYAYHGDQWVGFDDIAAVKIKAQYIVDNGLGGAMMWSIDMDDFSNICGDGKFPLLNALKTNLK